MTSTEQSELASQWFLRLFGVAVVAHLAGNPTYFGSDVPTAMAFAVGAAGIGLLVAPSWRLATATGGLVLATVWFEAPRLGNHWLVVGFVATGFIAGSLSCLRFGSRVMATRWWELVAPVGRLIFLVFYSFSAFAKLNRGFLHQDESCGVFYVNQLLGSWQLPLVEAPALRLLTIVAVIVIELSVPVLLLRPSTRRHGVVLALAFHFVISLDFDQHFYDFSSVVFLLAFLFLPDHDLADLERRARRSPPVVWVVAGGAAALVVASVSPLRPLTDWILGPGAFLWWVPTSVLIGRQAIVHWGQPVGRLDLRPRGLGWLVLIALVVNGLSPYLELKTATGFNMYSNLRTVDGETNHYVVPRTISFRDDQHDPVMILETNDAGLQSYVVNELALTRSRLADYLSYADSTVTVRFVGVDSRVEQTVTADGFGERLGVLSDKFGLFRSIDQREHPRCQALWFAAY